MNTRKRVLWTVIFLLLVVLAVPWFLWGNSATAWGLPLWLWWHVGWMILAALVFACFTTSGWELFIRGENHD